MHLIGHLERLAKVEVHQEVHSQELSSRIMSFPSWWKLAPARATSFKSFLRNFNKIESSSIWLSYVIGIDLEGRQIGQNSHLKRELKLSIKS